MLFGSRLNRLATSIRRGISKYSVGSDNPGLVFDFIDNFYQKDKNQTVNFDGAITHVRNGNAVMTDGYGPELVVNGGFDSDASGWTVDRDAVLTVTDGKLNIALGTNTYSGIIQELTLKSGGGTYDLEFDFTKIDANARASVGTTSGGSEVIDSLALTSAGKQSVRFTATTETVYVRIFVNSPTAGESITIDNVSVREMPVLKWAPHNLVTYSEDYSSWSGNALVESETTTAPDGVGVATKITDNQTGSIRYIAKNTISVADTGTYTACVFIKKDQDETRFPAIILAFRNGTGVDHGVQLNTKTGAVDEIGSGADSFGAESVGDYWKLSVTGTNNGTGNTVVNFEIPPARGTSITTANVGATGSIFLWGAHVYRSDLGGMVDNPDRGDSYVPTTSSAKYLPRIGHHVYNGSAWVNEGLLAESESRVNLLQDSFISGSNWTATDAPATPNAAVSPDGTENADSVIMTGSSNQKRAITTSSTITGGDEFTVSAYVKENSGSGYFRLIAFDTFSGFGGWFDTSSGEWATTAALNNGTLTGSTVQDVGNDWYRVSLTGTMPNTNALSVWMYITDADNSTTRSTTVSQYQYGFQAEVGSTPSSHIPTSGQQGTREAESFTIPSANLPWPSPNYIGSELVTNGTFDTDSDWTKGGDWTISGGVASSSGTSGRLNQSTSSVANSNVFIVSLDVVAYTSGTVSVEVGSLNGKNLNVSGTGTYEAVLVSGGSSNIGIYGSSFVGSIDNISVREIDPLSVSIAMDGRMTYADTGAGGSTGGRQGEAVFYTQFNDASNYLEAFLSTASTAVGEVQFAQESSGTRDTVATAPFSPDILVPFNIASRHGSTFINGAVDGVALTANTTPTALSDLSATDLDLAYDYMGTVGTFRVWDKDLGDDGLVEATNPSLEPSLSLTFEGTGTNSFVVNNWSE